MLSGIPHDRMPLSNPVVTHIRKHGAFQNSAAAKCRVFSQFMQCEKLPNDHLPEWGQQKLGSEGVLLIEGKVVRRLVAGAR